MFVDTRQAGQKKKKKKKRVTEVTRQWCLLSLVALILGIAMNGSDRKSRKEDNSYAQAEQLRKKFVLDRGLSRSEVKKGQ